MMKRTLAVILALVLLFGYMPAFAQERHSYQVTVVTSDSASAVAAGAWVYGLGMYASAANGVVGIYDYATLVDAGSSRAKAEVGHATSGMTTTVWFDKPIYFTYAISVKCTSAVAFIYTGPAP